MTGSTATVAYSALTGAQLWARRYKGGSDPVIAVGSAVAVSPSGGTVFVTGSRASATSGIDYATVAYHAATGARRWATSYSSPGDRYDRAFAVTVNRAGSKVFVSGFSGPRGSDAGGYATVAFSAAGGKTLWAAFLPGVRFPGECVECVAPSIAASPASGSVFIGGTGYRPSSGDDYIIAAYSG